MTESLLPPIPNGPYIFLGGTCGNNEWRKKYSQSFGQAWHDFFKSTLRFKLPDSSSYVYTSQVLLAPDDISKGFHDVNDIGPFSELMNSGRYDDLFFFNPVVDGWSAEHRKHERLAKLGATAKIYGLGFPDNPESGGASAVSAAEAAIDMVKDPKNTALLLLDGGPFNQSHGAEQIREIADLIRDEVGKEAVIFGNGNYEIAAQWGARIIIESLREKNSSKITRLFVK